MLETEPMLFRVAPENQHARLSLGSRQYAVQIHCVSRSSFKASVKQSIAKKLAIGKSAKLYFQDTAYRVAFMNKWLGTQGQCEVEMSLVEELEKPTLKKKSFFASSKTVNVGAQDPVLPTSLLAAFIVTVLILPAWGGKWGTSEALCNGATALWNAMSDLVTGHR